MQSGYQNTTIMDNEQTVTEDHITANIDHVRSIIAEAALRVGRAPEEITLVAVSKTMPVELVQMAYNLGVTDFGENRVQEALPKSLLFIRRGYTGT